MTAFMASEQELRAVLENIRDPHKRANSETICQVIRDNPSLRGIVYGYVSELEFERHYLKRGKGIERFSKDDDHQKTKSDRTVIFEGKPITIQIKSVQTNSLRFEDGRFLAKVQNDVSDRRRVTLPNGTKLETTCYVVAAPFLSTRMRSISTEERALCSWASHSHFSELKISIGRLCSL